MVVGLLTNHFLILNRSLWFGRASLGLGHR